MQTILLATNDLPRRSGPTRHIEPEVGNPSARSIPSGSAATAPPRPVSASTRSSVLAAASALIAERGTAPTELDGIARAAGTDPAAVRYWFGSVDEIVAEALRATEERLSDELNAHLAGVADPAGKLSWVIQTSVVETNWALWLELESRALRDESLRIRRRELQEKWRALVARIIRAGSQNGVFAPVNADEAAMTITGTIDGLCASMTLGDPELTRGHVLHLCVDVCERLLGARLELIPSEA